jgi:hypothetical protein
MSHSSWVLRQVASRPVTLINAPWMGVRDASFSTIQVSVMAQVPEFTG